MATIAASKFRVRADWDRDGFINNSISPSTPPNLFPAALYTRSTNLRGLQYTTNDDIKEDITEVSDLGFQVRRVKMGKTVSENYGETIRMGFTELEQYQPSPSDPINLWEGATQFLFNGTIPVYCENTNLGGPMQIVPDPDGVNGEYTYANNTNHTSPHYGRGLTLGYGNASSGGYSDGFPYDNSFGFFPDYFLDGPTNRYFHTNLTTTPSTPTWGGLPVSASTSYTLVFRLRNKANVGYNTQIRVYGRDLTLTGTPNYTRVWLAGSDVAVNALGNWQTVSYTFTTPAGCTQIAISLQNVFAGVALNQLTEIGGLQLFAGTVTPPTRFFDSLYAYREEQFNYTLEADKDYTLSFWVRSLNEDIVTLDGVANTYQLDGITAVSEGAVTKTGITAEWSRVDVYFPSRAYNRGYAIDFSAYNILGLTGLDQIGEVDFKGFMLCEGSTVWPYHVGTSYGYDDITSYVLSVQTKSGKNDFHEGLAYEGTAEFTLNNTERIFSPSNPDGPLYGLFDQNCKVIIEVKHEGVWFPLWTGWSFKIGVTPGRYIDRQATLECQQGFFRLRETTFSAPLLQETRIDDVLRVMIANSGWKSANTPFSSFVGNNMRLTENAYVLDTDAIFTRLDEGVNKLELVGQDWGAKTDSEGAIKDLLESENASLWVDRDGKIVMVNRKFWIEDITPVAINVDHVEEAEYAYGEGVTNQVKVIINRKRLQLDAAVWKTHRAFKIIKNGQVNIEIHAERTEGRQKTVIEYTVDNMTKNVYVADPGAEYTNPQNATTEQADKVVVTLIPLGSGNLYMLRIVNTNTVDLWIDVELKGDYLETEDGTPYTIEDTAAIALLEGVHSETFTTNILDSEAQAVSYAKFRLLRDAYPEGQFNSITFKSAVITADSSTIVNTKIGDRIILSETQTVETDVPHYIIAEEFSITGGTLSAVYRTTRAFAQRFLILDDEDARAGYSTGNLISDMYNVATYSGGTVEVEDDVIVYSTNNGLNKLILNPARGQVREWAPANYPLGGYLEPWDTAAFGFVLHEPEIRTDDYYIYTGSSGIDYLAFSRTEAYASRASSAPMLPVVPGAKYEAITNGRSGSVSTPGLIENAGVRTVAAKNWANSADAVGVYYDTLYTTQGGWSVTQFLTLDSWRMVHLILNAAQRIGTISLVQYSKVRSLKVDPTVGHKYTLFARKDTASVGLPYVLTVYDYNGDVIGTHTLTVSNAIQKFEVDLPIGTTWVFATFERVTKTYRDTTVRIYAHGVTQSSVTSYTDLIQTATLPIIFP